MNQKGDQQDDDGKVIVGRGRQVADGNYYVLGLFHEVARSSDPPSKRELGVSQNSARETGDRPIIQRSANPCNPNLNRCLRYEDKLDEFIFFAVALLARIKVYCL